MVVKAAATTPFATAAAAAKSRTLRGDRRFLMAIIFSVIFSQQSERDGA